MPRDQKGVTKLSVDFTGVEDRQRGGSAAHVQPGDYLLKLDRATVEKNASGDGQHVLWVLSIEAGPEKSAGKIYHRTTLKPEHLWSLRNMLQDLLEREIPKKALNVDFAKYVGKSIGASLEDDEPYNGKVKSKIAYTFPASEFEGLTSDDDAAELDESDDEEELATDEVESEDDDELVDVDEDDL